MRRRIEDWPCFDDVTRVESLIARAAWRAVAQSDEMREAAMVIWSRIPQLIKNRQGSSVRVANTHRRASPCDQSALNPQGSCPF